MNYRIEENPVNFYIKDPDRIYIHVFHKTKVILISKYRSIFGEPIGGKFLVVVFKIIS